MKDFITEAWLRANHTLSEGAEIHLPADSRLTPSARELLESRHLRIKFIDEQGRLFVDDEQQQPQPVHGLTVAMNIRRRAANCVASRWQKSRIR